jgi:peptidoglycan/LPS O-acetylase OafA/YrhL
MLGIIQASPIPERGYLANSARLRIAVAIIALLLLWTISSSLFVVKSALTIAAILAALVPLEYVEKGLSLLQFTRPVLIYVGSVSYAIYAIHAPIIALAVYYLPLAGSALRIIAVCVVILVVSHVMEFIVQPLFSGINRVRTAT